MTRTLDWKAAIAAGIVAGVVFMMLEMLLVQMFQPMSMWAPPRMIAAMAMGREILPPPDTFDAMALMVAMLIHFPLSIIYAIILGWIISRWELGLMAAMIAGLVFGLVIYVVNFYGFTAVFPWFADARGWVALFSHAMFGLVLGLVYEPLERHDERHKTASQL
ncbi:hypothetical protein [Nitratireductor thuwali]|uniref:Sodium:proline symporter n=1 Tax=Nitratireductor thuwali TaxID=2267699 RepID=A0ABY5MEX1_9HYPH|nr:hypothetical protein NTH_00161 [Nitratireductor thuwali]